MAKPPTRLMMVGNAPIAAVAGCNTTGRPAAYRPATWSRREKYTESGITVWYVKQAILDDVQANLELAQLLATAAGIRGYVAEHLSSEVVGPQRDATVDFKMKNRSSARVGLSVTVSDRYYHEEVLQLHRTHSDRLLDDPTPKQAGWLFIAAGIFFEKVMKGTPANTCSFEQLQAVARKELAETLHEATMRAEDALTNVGNPPHPLWYLFAGR